MKKKGYRISICLLVLFTSISATPQSRRHPAGTIMVTTEIPGKLMIDNLPVKKMTVYHHLLITGIDTGSHTISLLQDARGKQTEIHVHPGFTDQYVIRPDTVILSSTVRGRVTRASGMRFHSTYIPKFNGWYYLARVGYSAGKESNYFNARIVAGYDFSPLVSLGIGTGFIKNNSTFHYNHITTVSFTTNWGHEKMTSSGFTVPFVPVFLTFRSSISKKRVVPYLSVDIGCSIPLIQKIDGAYTLSEDYGYPMPYSFHVDKINAGWYFGINPGVKCYLYTKYYLDLSMGGDICVNKFKGNIPHGKSSAVKSTSNFHMTVGFGF